MTSLQKSATDFDCKKIRMQYQMDGTLDPRPKRGLDVKIIIQSLKMDPVPVQATSVSRVIACNPAKMFKSMIQHANDSGSMDTSLEYKPLSTVKKKSELNHQKIPYVDELRQILKENKNTQLNKVNAIGTPSKLPFANKKNLPETPVDLKIKPKNNPKSMPKICEKFIDTIKLSKKMPASSTPYRSKQDNETNNNCKGEINLMTPSADVRFIDSDNETTDGDFNRTLVKCYSMTRASCRQMSSFRKSFRKPDCKLDNFISTSPKFERRSLFTSSFNGTTNRSSIVSTNEVSPLRRQRNIKMKNSKLMNFFRSSKVNHEDYQTMQPTNLTQTCNNLSQMLAKSDQNFDELGCVPLLTKDNIDYYTGNEDKLNDGDKTMDWGDKFEFSFICEPSTSDIGEEDGLDLFPMTEIEADPTNIPFLRNDPTSIDICEMHHPKKENKINCHINSSPFRRSISDPALIRLATIYNKSTFCLNHESDFNDPLDFYNDAIPNIVSDLIASFEHQSNTFYVDKRYIQCLLSASFLCFVKNKRRHRNSRQ